MTLDGHGLNHNLIYCAQNLETAEMLWQWSVQLIVLQAKLT